MTIYSRLRQKLTSLNRTNAISRQKDNRRRLTRAMRLESLENRFVLTAAGDLDATFGIGGLVTTDFSYLESGLDNTTAIAVAADGKTVVTGTTFHSGRTDLVIARYNLDGSLDASFGTGGIARFAPEVGSNLALHNGAVAAMDDGRIVVGGVIGDNFTVMRITITGQLDSTFGVGGKRDISIASAGDRAFFVNDIDVLSDGSVILVGDARLGDSNSVVVVARLTSSGLLDTTFDTDGKQIIDLATGTGTDEHGVSIVLQTDGSALVGGYGVFVPGTGSNVFMATRLTATGQLDTSFGTDGKQTVDFDSRNSFATDIALQSDGSVVLVGTVGNNIGMARLTNAGQLDTSFGIGGKQVVEVGSYSSAGGLMVKADGSMVVAGFTYEDRSVAEADVAMIRLNSTGQLDESFGIGGKQIIDTGTGDLFGRFEVKADGSVAAAGGSFSAGRDIKVASLTSDGQLETSFGGVGIITTDILSPRATTDLIGTTNPIAIGSDGKIVVAGFSTQATAPGFGFAVARYNPDGNLDTSFGIGGRVSLGFGIGSQVSVAIGEDGRVLIVGTASFNTDSSVSSVIARLTSSGQLDESFNGNGKQFVNFLASTVRVQADGAVVVTGGYGDVHVVRLTNTGLFDETFGVSGAQTIDFGGYEVGTGLLTQSDGSMFVSGYAYQSEYFSDGGEDFERPTNSTFVVARLTNYGQLDTSFNVSGKQIVDVDGEEIALGLSVNDSGSVTMAGYSRLYSLDEWGTPRVTSVAAAMVRLTGDGQLDSSFNATGTQTINLGSNFDVTSSSMGADGSVVFVGSSYTLVGSDVAITRLTSTGQLDNSFGLDGAVVSDFGSSFERATGAAIGLDGKILVASYYSTQETGLDFAVARYHGISDYDDDGIEDSVDSQPLTYSNDFSDGTTSGTITNRGNQNITIVDSFNSAEGLLITSDFLGGATPATIVVTGELSTRPLTVGLQFSVTHIPQLHPTDINLSVASIAENQPSGSVIGQFTSVDNDVDDAFYYTLVPGDGDADNSSFTIDGDQLIAAASFDYETKANYSIRVRTTDLTGLTFEKSFVISVTDVAESIPPVIGAFDTTVTFIENGTAVLLDTNTTLTDVDSLDFIGGVMTVSLIANSETTDRVLIRNQGTGAGQIGVSANQVTFAGNPLATFAGGSSGDDPLVISFGAGGSKVAAQALLRNLTFSSVSDSPSTLPRTVQVMLADGDGGESLPVTKTINVTTVNDAPVIANFAAVASYTEGDAPVLLGTGTTVLDVDSADFATGVLTVRVLVNSQTTDRLSIRNDGLAPGDIGVNGTNVLYGSVVIGAFTGTTTLTITLNADANAAAVQALLRNVTFSSISLAPSTLTRTISAALTDGDGGTSASVTTLVNVIALNSAPTIGAFDTTVTYVENAAPVLLDTNATVADIDSLDFNGGILSVTLTDNSENDDRLAVRNQGVAATQVGVIGNQLSFGGTLIGEIFGGTSGSDPLQIAFNASATPLAVQAVLRNITFNNVSQVPSTLPRTVEVQLTDGDGGTSDPVTKTINVTAVNNAPVISNFSGVVSYTEGDDPVLLAVTASVFDVDSTDFESGRLTVSVSANSQTTDRITITNEGNAPGQIGVSGSTVTYGGTVIGIFTGTTSLIVTLNSSASQAAVQALVANIAFSSLSGAPSTLLRTISASLTDGDGGTSATVTKTVQVFTTNNAPVIGAFDTTVTFVENGVPVILDTNATVIDSDLLDFEDGVLTVSLIANGHADDRLEIRNQGVGANQIGVIVDEVTFGGVVIGTFSGGTSGSEPLEILLNVSANQAAVQALVRNLTFRNVSESPSNLVRTVELQLTDGDGGSSAPVTKSINVTAVNDAPVITNFSGLLTYTEDTVLAIAIDSIVDDLDSADFNTGRLIASVTANSQSTDRITIRKDGEGPGQIWTNGTDVTYSGIVIGTFTGTTTLTVTLNAAADKAAVQALLRNISFSSISEAPSTLQRTIRATLSDGDGGTSLAVTTLVEVVAINDPPVVGGFTPNVTYVENAVPLLIDSNATVTDIDSADFADGFMTVSLTANGHADDRLSIRNQGSALNQIGVAGGQVTYSGIVIATFVGGTSGLDPLQITFNAVASKAAVQALVRNLAFSNVSDNPSTLPRTVSLTVNDGDGGTSLAVTKTINVTAVNDAPTIGGFGGNVGYSVASATAVVLDSDATVDDPDTGNFNTGVLTVSLTTNRQTTDRIEILSVGNGLDEIRVDTNQIFYEGVQIGTFGGTTTLTVTLNSNASKAAVQKLLRSITFRSLSATPSLLPRTVSVSLSDGAGGTSIAQTKTIDMV